MRTACDGTSADAVLQRPLPVRAFTTAVVVGAAFSVLRLITCTSSLTLLERQAISSTRVHVSNEYSYEDMKNSDESLLSFNQRLYPKRKLGDGCYHVLLDVGANIGVHTRFMLESKKYPNAGKARMHFNKVFGENVGGRDPRDFCSFAFEPNPMHLPRFFDFKEAYDNMGRNMLHIPAGVSDRVGNISFYHDDKGANSEWGFTAVPQVCNGSVECRPEVLPVI
jgi:hypothetical protein